MTRLRSLDHVASHFRSLGATVERVGPDLLRFPTLWGPERPAWVKWDDAHQLVLLSQTLPAVDPSRLTEAALEIHRLHRELSVLGFVLDVDSGALDFRTHLVQQPDGSIRRDLLDRTFTFVVDTCRAHAVRLTLGPELAEPWWADDDAQ